MTKILLLLVLIISCITTQAQSVNPKYNKSLADSLGADNYGMKMYVLVILKTGPKTLTDKATEDSLFGGHMKNIMHLAEIGKLVVAGPLQKNTNNYRGIFIFNVQTIEEATMLLQTDPAIKAQLLAADLFQWYGSAALPLYLKYHDNVKKQNF